MVLISSSRRRASVPITVPARDKGTKAGGGEGGPEREDGTARKQPLGETIQPGLSSECSSASMRKLPSKGTVLGGPGGAAPQRKASPRSMAGEWHPGRLPRFISQVEFVTMLAPAGPTCLPPPTGAGRNT